MLPANVISALQAFSNAGRPLVTATKDMPQPVNKLEPGQQLQGTIQSKVSEGTFNVQVAGQMLQMRLPGNLQGGDTIKLQVISLQPHITFGLVQNNAVSNNAIPATPVSTPEPVAPTLDKLAVGQELKGMVQTEISEGLFKVQVAGQTLQMRLPGDIKSGDAIKLQVVSLQPRITFSMLASTNPLSTPEQIGSAARLLANLADQPLERPAVQQLGDKAVWPAAEQAPDPKKLAGALQEALGKSGLFYESHKAQWIRGERSTNQLLEEPQNMLTGKNLPSSPVNLTQEIDNSPLVQAQANASIAAKASDDTSPPIAKELIPLVQQQLHTLEQHHMVWLGQVWPGQQMQWEIQGEHKHERQQPNERQWSTEMELALPKLGGIQAHLMLAEGGLRLTLRAADSTTVDLFNRSLPGLKNSLEDAGIPLAAAMVEKS
jgi:hypothetical protein